MIECTNIVMEDPVIVIAWSPVGHIFRGALWRQRRADTQTTLVVTVKMSVMRMMILTLILELVMMLILMIIAMLREAGSLSEVKGRR